MNGRLRRPQLFGIRLPRPDPACGSGNFLYVTLEHLKRLEGEVMQALTTYAGQQVLDMTGGLTVTPAQFLGLEINLRAAARLQSLR